MLNIGWGEMAVIAVVTLIVVGPKELPNVLRTGAHWMRQVRKLSREFQSGVDSLVREAELEDAKKIVTSVKQGTIKRQIETEIDPTGEVSKSLDPKEIVKQTEPGPATKAATTKPAASNPAAGPVEPKAPGAAPAEAAAKPAAVVVGPASNVPAKPAGAEPSIAPSAPAVPEADAARKTGS